MREQLQLLICLALTSLCRDNLKLRFLLWMSSVWSGVKKTVACDGAEWERVQTCCEGRTSAEGHRQRRSVQTQLWTCAARASQALINPRLSAPLLLKSLSLITNLHSPLSSRFTPELCHFGLNYYEALFKVSYQTNLRNKNRTSSEVWFSSFSSLFHLRFKLIRFTVYSSFLFLCFL